MSSHPAAFLLLAAAAVALAGACDLPQNDSGASDVAADGADGTGEMRTWRLLLLSDASDAEPSPLPGADVDAVIAFVDGQFLFAGCQQATLFGQDKARYPENEHADPAEASLAVREQATSGGFVSLGGGDLLCELPLPVETGDRVMVWEVGGDGDEAWEAAFAETAGDGYTGAGRFEGSAEVVAP